MKVEMCCVLEIKFSIIQVIPITSMEIQSTKIDQRELALLLYFKSNHIWHLPERGISLYFGTMPNGGCETNYVASKHITV